MEHSRILSRDPPTVLVPGRASGPGPDHSRTSGRSGSVASSSVTLVKPAHPSSKDILTWKQLPPSYHDYTPLAPATHWAKLVDHVLALALANSDAPTSAGPSSRNRTTPLLASSTDEPVHVPSSHVHSLSLSAKSSQSQHPTPPPSTPPRSSPPTRASIAPLVSPPLHRQRPPIGPITQRHSPRTFSSASASESQANPHPAQSPPAKRARQRGRDSALSQTHVPFSLPNRAVPPPLSQILEQVARSRRRGTSKVAGLDLASLQDGPPIPASTNLSQASPTFRSSARDSLPPSTLHHAHVTLTQRENAHSPIRSPHVDSSQSTASPTPKPSSVKPSHLSAPQAHSSSPSRTPVAHPPCSHSTSSPMALAYVSVSPPQHHLRSPSFSPTPTTHSPDDVHHVIHARANLDTHQSSTPILRLPSPIHAISELAPTSPSTPRAPAWSISHSRATREAAGSAAGLTPSRPSASPHAAVTVHAMKCAHATDLNSAPPSTRSGAHVPFAAGTASADPNGFNCAWTRARFPARVAPAQVQVQAHLRPKLEPATVFAWSYAESQSILDTQTRHSVQADDLEAFRDALELVRPDRSAESVAACQESRDVLLDCGRGVHVMRDVAGDGLGHEDVGAMEVGANQVRRDDSVPREIAEESRFEVPSHVAADTCFESLAALVGIDGQSHTHVGDCGSDGHMIDESMELASEEAKQHPAGQGCAESFDMLDTTTEFPAPLQVAYTRDELNPPMSPRAGPPLFPTQPDFLPATPADHDPPSLASTPTLTPPSTYSSPVTSPAHSTRHTSPPLSPLAPLVQQPLPYTSVASLFRTRRRPPLSIPPLHPSRIPDATTGLTIKEPEDLRHSLLVRPSALVLGDARVGRDEDGLAVITGRPQAGFPMWRVDRETGKEIVFGEVGDVCGSGMLNKRNEGDSVDRHRDTRRRAEIRGSDTKMGDAGGNRLVSARAARAAARSRAKMPGEPDAMTRRCKRKASQRNAEEEEDDLGLAGRRLHVDRELAVKLALTQASQQ